MTFNREDRTVVERVAVIETNMKSIEKKLDTHTMEQRQDFEKVFNKLDDHIKYLNESLNKKADKTELISLWKKFDKIWWYAGSISGGIALLAFIISHFILRS